jgi:thiol-disulfide isomerase/thioredoxin
MPQLRRTKGHLPRHLPLIVAAVIACLTACTLFADVAAPDPQEKPARKYTAELQLRNGDHLMGEWVAGGPRNTIRWQTVVAARPFDFVPQGVVAVYYPTRQPPGRPEGIHCVELEGGDVLFGVLELVTSEKVLLATEQFGTLTIDATHVSRIVPWSTSGGITYLGPDGLAGWRKEGDSDKADALKVLGDLGWRDAAGHLVADQAGPPITRDCPIPTRSAIEVSFSWQAIPDFGVTLYVEGEQQGTVYPVRFQVLDHQLLLIAEGEERADLAVVESLDDGGGRFHGVLYVDGTERKANVYSLEGKPLAKISLPSPLVAGSKPPASNRARQVAAARGRAPSAVREVRTTSGVTLRNRSTDFRFERLLVRAWDGRLPNVEADGSGVVHTADSHHAWQKLRFSGETQELLVTTAEGDVRVPLDEVAGIVFPSPQPGERGTFRITLVGGIRLKGEIEACRDEGIVFQSGHLEEPIEVPLEELNSVVSMAPSSEPVPALSGRQGHLEWKGSRVRGVLIDSASVEAGSPLVWHPWGSTTPQALNPGLAGRIVFNEPASETDSTDNDDRHAGVAPQPARPAPGLFQMIFGGNIPTATRPTGRAVKAGTDATLYLRSGDRFPGELVSITESTAHFESAVTTAKAVPLNEMVMWERDHQSQLDSLDPETRRRLLTVPRVQRNNPPTHLLETFDGDFLRGRLVGVEAESIIMEVRLDEKRVALPTVRRILWLENTSSAEPAEGVMTESAPPESASDPDSFLVLAVQRSNTRLAFTPLNLTDGILSGTSVYLGDCQIKLDQIDVLYLGAKVAARAQAEQVAKWQMMPAKDPKFVSEEDDTSPAPNGTDAPLVGQEAPDFRLKTLEGKDLQLRSLRGSVVVLDFFATWCGPCVQAMPQVDALGEEFAPRGVKLVAVNMQEDAASVKGLMERLKLDPTVVLDIDGATAEKYSVTAIPQTVVIDRDGKVARLFVGGGPTFLSQLREALESLTSEAPEVTPETTTDGDSAAEGS